MSCIVFSYADSSARFLHKKEIKEFVKALFSQEKKMLKALQYIFCSDEFLLGINQQFLKHDDYTDIITFDISDHTKKDIAVIGEIYISVERVRENAQIFNSTFQQEMQRVIFHGALHLCGYKDKTKSEKMLMRQKEDKYLRLFEKQIAR